MDRILEDLVKEIPSINKYKNRPFLSILKYIDMAANGGKGFIELSHSEDLSKKYLKKGFFADKSEFILKALEVINNSFNKSGNDKFTNLDLVEDMIKEYEDIYGWHPNDKYLFPCNRYGNFSIKVIIRLMNSKEMKDFIEDEFLRYKHIIENQIYIVDEKPVNNFIYKILTDIGCEFDDNIFTGEFLYNKFIEFTKSECGFDKSKFTATFCDPDFVDSTSIGSLRSSTSPFIYQKYVLKSIFFSKIVVCLTPANWMQTNSIKLKPLSDFRSKIKSGNNLRKITYLDTYNKYVKNDIITINNGGLSYFIYEINYNGPCFIGKKMIDLSKIDIIPTSLENLELIYFVNEYCKINGSLKGIYDGLSGCLKSNDKRLCKEEFGNDIKVITSKYSTNFYGDKNSGVMFCDSKKLSYIESKNLNSWKVLIPETCSSAGKGLSSNMILSEPGELYTNTFGVFVVNDEKSANSLISYLKTDFVENIISKLKIKNHINKHILDYLPIIPLDRKWNSLDILRYINAPVKIIEEISEETILMPIYE